MTLKDILKSKYGCNRCGFCCAGMTVGGFPKDVYTNGIKTSQRICTYLEIDDDKTSCKIHDSPQRPYVCKEFSCEMPRDRFVENIFFSKITTIPLNSNAEDAFSFYYRMWKSGHFKNFSLSHIPKKDTTIIERVMRVKDFLYTHFERDDLPDDVRQAVSDPEWYNFWGVKELIQDLMSTILPFDLYQDSQKFPRLKAVLIEWQLFDKIKEICEEKIEKTPTILASISR